MASYDPKIQVCRKFEQGKRGKSGSFTSDGITLKTYRVVLAYWEHGQIYYTPNIDTQYSRTSSFSQHAVRMALGDKPIKEQGV